MTSESFLQRFADYDVSSAPAAARPLIERVDRHLGYLPVAVSRMAACPALLDGFLRLNASFEAGTLAPLEAEVLVMTVAVHNGCELCVAMHTARLVGLGAAPELVSDLRAARPLSDPRLDVLRRFTLGVMAGTGQVEEALWAEWLGVGFEAAQALEVVLGVGTYTLSTFANRMTGAPVDPALAAFAWAPTEAAVGTPTA
jgi:AhpD family alkylhydroperoxidase